ncbi:hypothetical protein UY3_11730 [Chelonia mydas]|uniref:Uncharacterized protein n=1 Tax=Chelonia mydas TaxID=8469 RepID=M7AZY4_CHEMY|nr:hypothetical protein UY3_11730 [Chelonia mydas]
MGVGGGQCVEPPGPPPRTQTCCYCFRGPVRCQDKQGTCLSPAALLIRSHPSPLQGSHILVHPFQGIQKKVRYWGKSFRAINGFRAFSLVQGLGVWTLEHSGSSPVGFPTKMGLDWKGTDEPRVHEPQSSGPALKDESELEHWIQYPLIFGEVLI